MQSPLIDFEGLCYTLFTHSRKAKMVKLYTLPSCVQCDSTKRFLKKNNIEFEEIDMSKDQAAVDEVRALGYTAAPVVRVGEQHWSGFRFELLNKLVA